MKEHSSRSLEPHLNTRPIDPRFSEMIEIIREHTEFSKRKGLILFLPKAALAASLSAEVGLIAETFLTRNALFGLAAAFTLGTNGIIATLVIENYQHNKKLDQDLPLAEERILEREEREFQKTRTR